MSLDVGFNAQVPSLPDAGAATSSLGETFSSDLSTGTADFSIPLDTPNGPNDVGPRLTLHYESSAGNGPFGLGFSLRLPRILRSLAYGVPQYGAADRLTIEGAGELLDLGDGTLVPIVDGGAWRIAVDGDGYRMMDRNGLIYRLGTSVGARLFDAAGSMTGGHGTTFAWHLEQIEDALGNVVDFQWDRDGNQLYLASVAYGSYVIRFDYAARPDTLRWGRPGFLVTTRLRCETIELTLPRDPQPLLRRWRLEYSQHEMNGCSLLSSVTMTGVDAGGAALDAPPLTLGYTTGARRTLERMRSVDAGATPGPLQRTGRRAEPIDWFGTGLPDLLEISDSGMARVWPNLGALTWGRPRAVGALPLFSNPDAEVAFIDLNGDGLADLVRTDRALSGYVPRTHDGFDRPVSWSRAPAMAPSDPNVRLIDADNDGVADLLTSNGKSLAIFYREDPRGYRASPQLVSRSDAPVGFLDDPHVFLMDMTGSGSADLVRVDGGGVTYWPALGRGRWGDAVVMSNPPSLPFNLVPERLFLQDIDGDGCADVVYLDQGRLTYWINQTGTGFSEPRTIDFLPIPSLEATRFADVRGNGVNGLLWSTTVASRVVYFFLDFMGGAKPYALDSIDNGCGLVTTVQYSTSAREAARDRAEGTPWSSSMPITLPVVAAITRRDHATANVSRTEYRYHEGRYDGILREFAGFGRVEATEVGDETAPTLVQTSWFHTGLDSDVSEPRTRADRMRLRAIRGRMYRQERRSPDGSPRADLLFDRLEQNWTIAELDTHAGVVHRPRLAESIRTVFERTPDPITRHVTANLAWDANGNVTDSVDTSQALVEGAPLHRLRTHADFAIDPAGRFISLLARTRQFDADDRIVGDRVTEYDHASEGSVGAQGLVTRRTALVLTDSLVTDVYGSAPPDLESLGYFRRADSDGWWVTQSAYTRIDDADGLRGSTTDANGATSNYAFNDARTFPALVTDPMGNPISVGYDERTARVVSLTDALGNTRAATYDALARVVARIEPGDSVALPTLSFAYDTAVVPPSVARQQLAVSGESVTLATRTIYDGAFRVIEQRETDEQGEVAILSRRYSSRGFVARVWKAFRRPSAAYSDPDDTEPFSATTYDAIGRTVRVVNPDGSVRTTVYEPLVVTESDEEDNATGQNAPHAGTPKRRRMDATGRVIAIEQNLAGRTLASTYAYDVKGNLIRHTDEDGNIVEYAFDLLGRQLRVRRPERDSAVVRDAAGRPVETRLVGVDPVFREFDKLGRIAALRIGSPQSTPLHAFTYNDLGQPAPPGAGANTLGGRLVRSEDESGTTLFDYDARGREIHRRWQATGSDVAFDIDFDFRSDGRLAAVTYPDGGSGRRRVENAYDARGRLMGVSDVVPEIQVDLDGFVTKMRYANGTELAVAYDDAMKRTLSRVITSPAGWRRATTFGWDRVGNLLAIDSDDQKLAISFRYDDLYRLVEAETALGEHFEYRYADNGAFTFKSDVGEYRYGEDGAAPTCVTTAGTSALSYAPTGDIASAPWGEHTFDALGRLRRITSGGVDVAEYVYDWKTRRVRSTTRDASGNASERLSPDPWYCIEDGALVLNLFAGDQVVARQSTGGTTVLHFDHLRGLVATSDQDGALIDTLRYDPYGRLLERNGVPPAQPMGFAGGENDTTGLVYLQARYYHPALGVFISVDPLVQDAMVSFAWSAYAYCADNPATLSDPSGLSFNLLKFTIGVVAVVAVVAAVVVSSGALAGPAIGGAEAAAEMDTAIYVAFGEATSGLVGGITTAIEEAKSGNRVDFWDALPDVVLGTVVGAAVGGWATYATVFGTAAPGKLVAEGFGKIASFGSDALSGTLNSAITQGAIGFAHAIAKPIAGTGHVLDDDFQKDIGQSLIAGAVSGAFQSAFLGPAMPPKTPWNTPTEAIVGNLAIVSIEQVATSQIDWHHTFVGGATENSVLGTPMDLVAGFAGIKLAFPS